VPLGAQARIAAWRAQNGWEHRLVGAFEGESLVGFASSSTAHDTPDTSWVDVSVRPQYQRRGVGTRLVSAAHNASPGHVRRFVANAYRSTAAGMDDLARRFAHPLGYTAASTETVVELDLARADLLAQAPADGYTVSTYLNGVPDRLRGQVGVLKGLVDAEAPHGGLGWEPTPVTAQEYQDEISLWQEQGRTAVESIALAPDGAVVAWTCLVAAADPTRPAQIEGTIVLAGHRGLRLGRAVKVASLIETRDHTSSLHVRTSSDDQNVWMRAINHELGFVPVESQIIMQKQRPAPPD
jgi:GNAT superfamily N-acetyltransferase